MHVHDFCVLFVGPCSHHVCLVAFVRVCACSLPVTVSEASYSLTHHARHIFGCRRNSALHMPPMIPSFGTGHN